jgi:lipoyl(octanoyl) transferase
MRICQLGQQPYGSLETAMREFTQARTAQTPDELWLVEHEPVFTQGVAGKPEHVLMPGSIPVVRTQRGGQVTYHGPGQVVAYPLVDLRRLGIYVKEYVFRLEQSVLATLADLGVTGHRVRTAPGVYVRTENPFGHAPLVESEHPNFTGLAKLAALGVKVSKHCTWHGAALNVAMDLEPFDRINPCGYTGLRTLDLRSLGLDVQPQAVAEQWAVHLERLLRP